MYLCLASIRPAMARALAQRPNGSETFEFAVFLLCLVVGIPVTDLKCSSFTPDLLPDLLMFAG